MHSYFFFEGYGDHRYLHVLTHSFPTRRSSDLSLTGCRRTALVSHYCVRRICFCNLRTFTSNSSSNDPVDATTCILSSSSTSSLISLVSTSVTSAVASNKVFKSECC